MINLVIWTTSTDENLSFMFLKLQLIFFESSDDALERRRYVGEICDASADNELLSFRVRVSGEQRENRSCVIVSLLLARST
jgi:hypothetical protein